VSADRAELTRAEAQELLGEDDEQDERDEGAEVARVPWDDHYAWLEDHVEAGHHISIFCPARGGKTYLIRRGLLPLWQRYPVLWIRFKPKDATLTGLGHVVRAYPTAEQRLKYRVRALESPKWETDPEWYVLALPVYRWSPDNKRESRTWHQARRLAGEALDKAYWSGGWVVVIDEVRALAGNDAPALGLGAVLENNWQRGADRPLTVICATQQPAHAPSSMYDQPMHTYIGRTQDVGRHQRLAEIGGDPEVLKRVLPTLEPYEFLYVHRFSGRMEIVKVPEGWRPRQELGSTQFRPAPRPGRAGAGVPV
jgi:hypothetical protein